MGIKIDTLPADLHKLSCPRMPVADAPQANIPPKKQSLFSATATSDIGLAYEIAMSSPSARHNVEFLCFCTKLMDLKPPHLLCILRFAQGRLAQLVSHVSGQLVSPLQGFERAPQPSWHGVRLRPPLPVRLLPRRLDAVQHLRSAAACHQWALQPKTFLFVCFFVCLFFSFSLFFSTEQTSIMTAMGDT